MDDARTVTIAAELTGFAGRIAVTEKLTGRSIVVGRTAVAIFPGIVSRTTTPTGITRTTIVAGEYITTIAGGTRPHYHISVTSTATILHAGLVCVYGTCTVPGTRLAVARAINIACSTAPIASA